MHIVNRYSLCARKAGVLTQSRGFMSTPASLLRSRVRSTRRQSNLNINDRLLEDSDFMGIEDDCAHADLKLEELQDEYNRTMKKKKNELWKILTKKKLENIPRGPNMITSNERAHMRFLHKLDPEYWNVERLSENFPALPYTVRLILKDKWTHESAEAMKKADLQVLKNWEKLKTNELEAPPEVLKHLKKFINRVDTLKSQMENPKFFPEIPANQKITLQEGHLTKYISNFIQERKVKEVNDEGRGGEKELVIADGGDKLIPQNKNGISILDKIKMAAEARGTDNDSFIIGKLKTYDKDVTLDELKQNILEKTENKKTLTKFDVLVLNKTLERNTRSEDVKVSEKINKSVPSESDEVNVKRKNQQMLLDKILRDNTNKENLTKGTCETEKTHSTSKSKAKSKTDEGLRENQTRNLTLMNVTQFLNPPEDIKPESEVVKFGMKFYGTEKDKQATDRNIEVLSNTCFLPSTDKRRRKSKDSLSLENILDSPHVAGSIKTYFSYDYPENIDIPEDKWKKGKTYRVKDCYYDDDGEFLYRVPGMELD